MPAKPVLSASIEVLRAKRDSGDYLLEAGGEVFFRLVFADTWDVLPEARFELGEEAYIVSSEGLATEANRNILLATFRKRFLRRGVFELANGSFILKTSWTGAHWKLFSGAAEVGSISGGEAEVGANFSPEIALRDRVFCVYRHILASRVRRMSSGD